MERKTEGTTVRGKDGKLSIPGLQPDDIEGAGPRARPRQGARSGAPLQDQAAAPGERKPAGASAEAGEES